MIIKLRSKRIGEDLVKEQVLVGEVDEEDERYLRQVGVLIMRVGEWQEFGATLLLGATKTNGRVKVIVEGDKEVVRKA